MNKSYKIIIVLHVILVFVLAFAGCGRKQGDSGLPAVSSGNAVTAPGGPTEINSEHGKIEDGAKAFSPDSKYFLQEVEPYGTGKIGVYENGTGKLIDQWDVLNGGKNDIKALAWLKTGDPKRFMVMYHGGTKPGITVYDVGKPDETGSIETTEYYHFAKFVKPDTISVSEKDDEWKDLKVKPSSGISVDTVESGKKAAEDTGKPKTDEPAGTPGEKIVNGDKKPTDKGIETAGGDTIVIKGKSSPFSYKRHDAVASSNGPLDSGNAYSKNNNIYVCPKIIDGKTNEKGILEVYRLRNKGKYKKVREIVFLDGKIKNDFKGIAISPDGSKVAVLFNYNDYNEAIVANISGNIIGGARNLPVNRLGWLHYICFSKDGKKILLAASGDSQVITLELEGLQ